MMAETPNRTTESMAAKKTEDIPGTNFSCASAVALMKVKLIPQTAVAANSHTQARRCFSLCMELRLRGGLALEVAQCRNCCVALGRALALAAAASQLTIFVKHSAFEQPIVIGPGGTGDLITRRLIGSGLQHFL